MRRYAIGGGSKVWLLDEVAELTTTAQKALLKMLEDTPEHVYFMLCTTDPQKLIKPIRTRCTEIALKPLDSKDLKVLIGDISDQEGKKVTEDVVDKITECSDGSARKALVLLDAVLRLESEEEMLEAIERSAQETQAINLCRMLLNFRPDWSAISKLLKDLEGEEPEGLRWMVLGYMRSVLLGGGKMADKAYTTMCCFERNFFDTKHNGLVMACWEAAHGK
jgi:DNA polymerase-3 subunit gamma/tau